MKHAEYISIAAVLIIILAGMVVAYTPGIYRCDFDAWEDGNNIHYAYTSNYSMETHTVLIQNETDYDINNILVYFDESYAAVNDWDLQKDMLDNLEAQLEIRSSAKMSYCTSMELADLLATVDVKTTAILIAAGAVSDVLYDGTPECPLIQWLISGGTIINMSGCLGKYISHGSDLEDMEVVVGYAELFTCVEGKEDADFYDSTDSIRTSYIQNHVVQDSLGIYFNEFSYGIDCSGMSDYISIGNTSGSGYSCAVIYKSYSGMVMNFGMTITYQSHTVHFVAQTIASGLDYTSNILDYKVGHTTNSSTGSFETDGAEGLHVYGYVGSARAVFGMKVIFGQID